MSEEEGNIGKEQNGGENTVSSNGAPSDEALFWQKDGDGAEQNVPREALVTDEEQQSLTSGDTDTYDESSTTLSNTESSVAMDDDHNGIPQGERSVLRKTMTAGFATLRQRRDNPNTSWRSLKEGESPEKNGASSPVDSRVSVNFIDPTTATSNTTTPTKATPPRRNNFSLLSQMSSSDSATPSPDAVPAVDLYEKLTTIFERDYRSTLHSIPYENVRSGARGTIEKLKIRSVLTRSHGMAQSRGVGKAASGDAMVPWGGTAATAAAPVSDPAEWHNGPYCHVYIAACESTEHYRNKVKPALQAFVSQIESAANSGSQTPTKGSEDMSTSGNYSPHYVIVYVPTGPKAQTGGHSPPPSETTNRIGTFASRLSGVRRRLENPHSGSSRDLSTDSIHSRASSMDGTETDYDSSDLAAAPPPGPVTHSSKLEKELYRRFTTDFPAGQTCIMSTLVDSVDDTSLATMSPLKNQEWNTFLHMLGSAIVSGFKDRCRRYDEELRRLDAHRATMPSSSTKAWQDVGPRFNLSHFFLVKESLAFTYEQMRLPEEALLQYEELRAFVPEPTDDDDSAAEKRKKKSRSKRRIKDIEDAMELAIAGDSAGFRRRLRSTTDMSPLAQVVLQYLFARESNLLFQLEAPVEIIRRSHVFVETSYRMKLNRFLAMEPKLTEEQKHKERTEMEKWALNFCWDVKCACDAYFSEADMLEEIETPGRPWGGPEEDIVAVDSGMTDDITAADSGLADESVVVHTEKDLARTMGDLLEFGRLRLVNLGDIELEVNPIRALQCTLPADTCKPWEPLESLVIDETTDQTEAVEASGVPMNVDLLQQRSLLDGAFDSVDSYESKYLELAEAIISFGRFSGRRRLASKLDGERAEIYIKRGNVQEAAKILLPIVDVCSLDRWERGHFWRLFRLACCQRATNNAPMYLSTLTHCFGQHLTPVAPEKALDMLQRDLEVVVGDAAVADFPLGIAPFLETELSVEPTSSGKSTMPLHYMRKKVINTFCLVGETATIELALTSHLRSPVEVQAIRIFVVAFDQYESLFHNKTTITSSEAFKILTLDAPVTVAPGLNKYSFTWAPMNTGHFILSTVQIQWKEACFYYDSAALRRPLLGLNVLPSDPTQSLELDPAFLIPGHVQQVRITFDSGSDNIRQGYVNLLGFEGLQVLPPGADPETGNWSRSCEVELSPCPPGETVVFTTFVKSSQFTGGGEQGMQAKVATSYCHALYDELSDDEKESVPAMKTVLEASVFTLDRPPLAIDSVSAFAHGKDRVMLNMSVHCNVPLPFLVKEWDVRLPGLLVNDGADLNQELFGSTITEDDQILFIFNCSVITDADESDMEPTLDIVLEDEFGKLLRQSLPFDLEDFYERCRSEELVSDGDHVTAELSCSPDKGPVGAPVSFLYNVDLSKLSSAAATSKVLYEISCDETEWVLSGKTQGSVDPSVSPTISLDFIAVPIHSGLVKSFPEIRLCCNKTDGSTMLPIHVQQARRPKEYTSLNVLSQIALACPDD
jgi:hypothetical protein